MTVVPTRVIAGTTDNELSFAFTADSAPLKGTTLVDVPRGWSKPQQTNPAAPGYVELQSAGCVGTRIAGIASRRIVIATQCPRRHLFRLLYHKAAAPLLSADGFVFLTQTRKASAPKKAPFQPLGPKKQPVVKVRGARSGRAVHGDHLGRDRRRAVRRDRARGRPVRKQRARVRSERSRSRAATPWRRLPAPYAYATKDVGQHTFTGIVMRTVRHADRDRDRLERLHHPEPADRGLGELTYASSGIDARRRS